METQPERTALSWQRTGFGALAVAGLLAHSAMRSGSPALLVAGCVAALCGLGTLAGLARVRYRQVRRSVATSTAVSAPGMVAAVTAVAVVTAAAAAVGVVVAY
jgi:putative membrane protein